MSRHGNRIHKRADGRWEGRYKIGNSESGKTIYSSVYGKSFSEAQHKLRQAESDHINNNIEPISNNMLFVVALTQWYNNNKSRLKKSTAHKYQYLIDSHIIPYFKGIKLNKLSIAQINGFATHKLEQGGLFNNKTLSKSYVRSMMLIIDAALKYAVENKWCQPISSPIFKPVPEKKEIKVLTDSELRQLEILLTDDKDLTSAGVLITIHTGLRIGEICALTWDDIDLENNILFVRSTVTRIRTNAHSSKTTLVINEPKTAASYRIIPFSKNLHDILLRFKDNAVSKYVISNTDSFVSPRTFEYRYHKLMSKYSMPNINYHALRHTFATRCVECGVDIKSLSEILGHSNVSITLNTYVHSSLELKRRQLEKLSLVYSV